MPSEQSEPGEPSPFVGSCHSGRVRFEVDGRNWEAQASADGWTLVDGALDAAPAAPERQED